jgi:hypothetical protein
MGIESCNRCPKSRTTDCFSVIVKDILLEIKTETDPDKIFQQAAGIHKKISDERIKARENGCLNVNRIDPDYPGKNSL